jgi:CheY-like chemotaxis protein
MNLAPLITTNRMLFERVQQLVAPSQLQITLVSTVQDARDYLGLEMPDLAIVDFSDPALDAFELLDAIQKDPWLLHSTILAICGDDGSSERLEELRSSNIAICLAADDLERQLPKVLGIILQNKRILFQRAVGASLVPVIAGSYKLHNDTVEANCYVNLVCNYLFNANKIDDQGKMFVHVALTEMLLNGIEHGNCGITYDEKGAWLENGGAMSDLIQQKCEDPTVASKRVLFEYTITPAKSAFFIADEGPGFDWRKQQDALSSGNLEELHGRGIRMTRKYTKNFRYNEKGNEVHFEIDHARDCTNTTPGLFENIEPLPIASGTTIFHEGETGDFLYYIVKGCYDVLVKNVKVSTLSPDDIFMGEMSFLLNNRRSATIRAATDGTLIRISKRDFVNAIKVKPHYALFLSRLLAQRVARRNAEVTGANASPLAV